MIITVICSKLRINLIISVKHVLFEFGSNYFRFIFSNIYNSFSEFHFDFACGKIKKNFIDISTIDLPHFGLIHIQFSLRKYLYLFS